MLKVLLIILCVLLALLLAAYAFFAVMTKPVSDTDENRYAVGNMVVSDTVEYQAESGKGIKYHPMVKMMEVVWRFCADSDAKVHAAQTPPADVTEVTDIPYLDDGNIYHRLDVYYPAGRDDIRSLPMIVDIHGGGWIYGDKELNKYYCLELAHKGYVVFNISYRLVPDVTVNEQLQDCLAAMQYINNNYRQFTDNPTMLLTGDSAGGMLSAYTAAIMASEELQETFAAEYYANGIMPKALLLTSPVAFMKSGGAFSLYTKPLWGSDYETKATYGYMDLSEIIDEAVLPPTYLITSSGDALAHDQTLRAYELLQEKGIACQLADYDTTDENGKQLQHVFSVLNPFNEAGQTAIDAALAFYQEAMTQ